MKGRFWLLYVNYEVKEHTPEIRLWDIDDYGKRVLVIDRNFLAYFYAIVEDKADSTKVVEEIEAEGAQRLLSRNLRLLNVNSLENK